MARVDSQRAEFIQGGHPVGEVLQHVFDPVQFGFALRVGLLHPRLVALAGDAASGEQAAQGLAADVDDAASSRLDDEVLVVRAEQGDGLSPTEGQVRPGVSR